MVGQVNVRDFNADRAIIDAATPGEWIFNGNEIVSEHDLKCGIAGAMTDADARFIAEARTGWPAALDEIERLQAEIKRHEQRIEFLTEFIRNRPDVQHYRQALESLLSVFNGNYITKNKPSTHVDTAIQKAKEALAYDGN